jgi:hypothetical protein
MLLPSFRVLQQLSPQPLRQSVFIDDPGWLQLCIMQHDGLGRRAATECFAIGISKDHVGTIQVALITLLLHPVTQMWYRSIC